jgi:hypothetical protein
MEAVALISLRAREFRSPAYLLLTRDDPGSKMLPNEWQAG